MTRAAEGGASCCMPVPRDAPPTARLLLRDNAYARIREAIVDGVLEPGERLVDAELCAWLGVSRTPVREALAKLDATGLVDTKPGRYTLVTPLDVRRTADSQAVVAAMHELAVRVAVPVMGPTHLHAMREANARFAAALDRQDVSGAIAADDDFHGTAVDLCANDAIHAVLDQHTPLLRRMEKARFSSAAARSSVEQHDRIAELAGQGDLESAGRHARLNWLTLHPQVLLA